MDLERLKDVRSIPSFLINLESRPDRLHSSLRRLRRSGIYPEPIKALTPQDNIPEVAESPRSDISFSEAACAASHLKVFRLIVERNIQRALIFEDDVLPSWRFVARSNRSIEQIPDDFLLLQLGWSDFEPLRSRGFRRIASAGLANLTGGLNKTLRGRYQWGCHAYVVSHKFATIALQEFAPIYWQWDGMMGDLSSREDLAPRCFVHHPPLALQVMDRSDLRAGHLGQYPTWRRFLP